MSDPIIFRDPFTLEQSTVEHNSEASPRPRANTHAVAHALYPGTTIFSAPGRALSVPRVERMRAAGKSIAKDAGATGGYGIEMTALPPSMGSPTKEDLALAKWRKWVVEQPATIPAPLATRNKSIPSSFSPPMSAPMTRGAGSGEASGSGSGSGSGRSGSMDDAIHYNTESILALRDVELAVDEGLVKARDAGTRGSSRVTPRVSSAENPFLLISERLGSRRVRPIILELVRSLGHYIYAVWMLEQGEPIPWVGRDDDPLQPMWKSHTLSAVHEARQGNLIPPPDLYQLTFWRAEVEYGLNDANAAVGVYKKQGWAFTQALRSGKYGTIEDVNVLTGSGAGNIVRMLNDLEEAIWGDGEPRDTDLAHEVPADFDMYARVVEPETKVNKAASSPATPTVSKAEEPPLEADWGLAAVLGTIEIPTGNQGRRETLEELGKKRHAEWLARRQQQYQSSPLAVAA